VPQDRAICLGTIGEKHSRQHSEMLPIENHKPRPGREKKTQEHTDDAAQRLRTKIPYAPILFVLRTALGAATLSPLSFLLLERIVMRAVCATLLLSSVLLMVNPGWPKSLYVQPQYDTIRVRLVAQEQPAPVTGGARNYDFYLVELQTKDGSRLARLSYSFLIQEPRIPQSLFDYNLALRFRARRDQTCDITLANLQKFPVDYSSHAPSLKAQPEEMLPCYVVMADDYKGSSPVKP
jgi:hypothetical protein